MMSKPTLEELGIDTDTMIIEVEGGLIQEIHNDKVPIRIFDWDNLKGGYDDNGEPTTIEEQEQLFNNMLSAIERED
jgi:hypothetical protein|tara:strand:- start:11172 stop:11399 length:228 start_codon:yes stop_codon:yes gene_type:complete